MHLKYSEFHPRTQCHKKPFWHSRNKDAISRPVPLLDTPSRQLWHSNSTVRAAQASTSAAVPGCPIPYLSIHCLHTGDWGLIVSPFDGIPVRSRTLTFLCKNSLQLHDSMSWQAAVASPLPRSRKSCSLSRCAEISTGMLVPNQNKQLKYAEIMTSPSGWGFFLVLLIHHSDGVKSGLSWQKFSCGSTAIQKFFLSSIKMVIYF